MAIHKALPQRGYILFYGLNAFTWISYFVSTVSDKSIAAVKNYIANQEISSEKASV